MWLVVAPDLSEDRARQSGSTKRMARLTISPIRSPRGHRNCIGSGPRECIQHSTRTAAAFTRSLPARYAAPAISSRCCGQVRWACIEARGGRKKLAEEDGTKCRLHVGEKRRRIKERLTPSQPGERKSGQPRKRIVMFFPSANSPSIPPDRFILIIENWRKAIVGWRFRSLHRRYCFDCAREFLRSLLDLFAKIPTEKVNEDFMDLITFASFFCSDKGWRVGIDFL